MNRLLVAFESDAVAQRVCEMLTAASIPVRSTHKTGAEVVRAIRYMGGGIVICGAKLTDITADDLFDDLEDMAFMLAVGKPEQLEMCENPGIFKLPLPINRYDLSASVRMLMQLEEMSSRRHKRTRGEQEAVDEAKYFLQTQMGMTEELAHHYLQKKSMDSGIRIADAARIILERYTKKD